MPFHKSYDNCNHCNSSGNWPAAVMVKHFLCLAGCKAAFSAIHPASVDIQMTVFWRRYSKEDKRFLAPKGPAERPGLWRWTEVKLSCAVRLISGLTLYPGCDFFSSPSHEAESGLQSFIHSLLKKKGQPCGVFTGSWVQKKTLWPHLLIKQSSYAVYAVFATPVLACGFCDLNVCHQHVLGNTVMDLDLS